MQRLVGFVVALLSTLGFLSTSNAQVNNSSAVSLSDLLSSSGGAAVNLSRSITLDASASVIRTNISIVGSEGLWLQFPVATKVVNLENGSTLQLSSLGVALPTTSLEGVSTLSSLFQIAYFNIHSSAHLLLRNVVFNVNCSVLSVLRRDVCDLMPDFRFEVFPWSIRVIRWTSHSVAAQEVWVRCGKAATASTTPLNISAVYELPYSGPYDKDVPCVAIFATSSGMVTRTVQKYEFDVLPETAYVMLANHLHLANIRGNTLLNGSKIVFAGDPSAPVQLDLRYMMSLFSWPELNADSVALTVRDLTLAGLPYGPSPQYPATLVTAGMWWLDFKRLEIGYVDSAPRVHLLNVDVVVDGSELDWWAGMVRSALAANQTALEPNYLVQDFAPGLAVVDGGRRIRVPHWFWYNGLLVWDNCSITAQPLLPLSATSVFPLNLLQTLAPYGQVGPVPLSSIRFPSQTLEAAALNSSTLILRQDATTVQVSDFSTAAPKALRSNLTVWGDGKMSPRYLGLQNLAGVITVPPYTVVRLRFINLVNLGVGWRDAEPAALQNITLMFWFFRRTLMSADPAAPAAPSNPPPPDLLPSNLPPLSRPWSPPPPSLPSPSPGAASPVAASRRRARADAAAVAGARADAAVVAGAGSGAAADGGDEDAGISPGGDAGVVGPGGASLGRLLLRGHGHEAADPAATLRALDGPTADRGGLGAPARRRRGEAAAAGKGKGEGDGRERELSWRRQRSSRRLLQANSSSSSSNNSSSAAAVIPSGPFRPWLQLWDVEVVLPAAEFQLINDLLTTNRTALRVRPEVVDFFRGVLAGAQIGSMDGDRILFSSLSWMGIEATRLTIRNSPSSNVIASLPLQASILLPVSPPPPRPPSPQPPPLSSSPPPSTQPPKPLPSPVSAPPPATLVHTGASPSPILTHPVVVVAAPATGTDIGAVIGPAVGSAAGLIAVCAAAAFLFLYIRRRRRKGRVGKASGEAKEDGAGAEARGAAAAATGHEGPAGTPGRGRDHHDNHGLPPSSPASAAAAAAASGQAHSGTAPGTPTAMSSHRLKSSTSSTPPDGGRAAGAGGSAASAACREISGGEVEEGAAEAAAGAGPGADGKPPAAPRRGQTPRTQSRRSTELATSGAAGGAAATAAAAAAAASNAGGGGQGSNRSGSRRGGGGGGSGAGGAANSAKSRSSAASAGSGSGSKSAAGSSGSRNSGMASDLASNPRTELYAALAAFQSELGEQQQQISITCQLGAGAHGVVYKGEWRGLEVAVKTLLFQAFVGNNAEESGNSFKEQAMLEAAIATTLFHPNVINTFSYDIKPLRMCPAPPPPGSAAPHHQRGEAAVVSYEGGGIMDWKLYIIQEYCDGGTLKDALDGSRFSDPETGLAHTEVAVRIAIEIAAGMSYIHARNIIHGDLKPANILLRTNSASPYGYTAKIADFGLALKLKAGESHISNIRRGTPFYIAAELVEDGRATTASDLYSFGVILWELLHGCTVARRLPLRRRIPNLPAEFYTWPPDCPPAYRDLATACLSSSPASRPRFMDALNKLSKLLSALVEAKKEQQRRRHEERQRRAAAAAAAAGAGAGAAAAAPEESSGGASGSTAAAAAAAAAEAVMGSPARTGSAGASGNAAAGSTAAGSTAAGREEGADGGSGEGDGEAEEEPRTDSGMWAPPMLLGGALLLGGGPLLKPIGGSGRGTAATRASAKDSRSGDGAPAAAGAAAAAVSPGGKPDSGSAAAGGGAGAGAEAGSGVCSLGVTADGAAPLMPLSPLMRGMLLPLPGSVLPGERTAAASGASGGDSGRGRGGGGGSSGSGPSGVGAAAMETAMPPGPGPVLPGTAPAASSTAPAVAAAGEAAAAAAAAEPAGDGGRKTEAKAAAAAAGAAAAATRLSDVKAGTNEGAGEKHRRRKHRHREAEEGLGAPPSQPQDRAPAAARLDSPKRLAPPAPLQPQPATQGPAYATVNGALPLAVRGLTRTASATAAEVSSMASAAASAERSMEPTPLGRLGLVSGLVDSGSPTGPGTGTGRRRCSSATQGAVAAVMPVSALVPPGEAGGGNNDNHNHNHAQGRGVGARTAAAGAGTAVGVSGGARAAKVWALADAVSPRAATLGGPEAGEGSASGGPRAGAMGPGLGAGGSVLEGDPGFGGSGPRGRAPAAALASPSARPAVVPAPAAASPKEGTGAAAAAAAAGGTTTAAAVSRLDPVLQPSAATAAAVLAALGASTTTTLTLGGPLDSCLGSTADVHRGMDRDLMPAASTSQGSSLLRPDLAAALERALGAHGIGQEAAHGMGVAGGRAGMGGMEVLRGRVDEDDEEDDSGSL